MRNSNDISADTYDIVSSTVKNDEITSQEVSLISFLIPPGSSILDIGAGTGRHALYLAQSGYMVTALDSSKAMLDVLKKKISENKEVENSIKIINKDFLKYKFEGKYDAIILMWNSFNEIFLTKRDVRRFFSRAKKILNNNGIILININNSDTVNPKEFNFDYVIESKGKKMKLHWETSKYNERTNTSTSKETVTYIDSKGTPLETNTFIQQRYWSMDDIKKIAAEYGFKISNQSIKGNDELYLTSRLNL